MGALDRSAMRKRRGEWFFKTPQPLTFIENMMLGEAVFLFLG
jgi:hypothetical protein